MYIEYEATFPNIKKKEIINKLKKIKATLKKGEFLQKRTVFYTPDKNSFKGNRIEWRKKIRKLKTLK